MTNNRPSERAKLRNHPYRVGKAGHRATLMLALLSILVPAVLAERTQLKPGWNIFSPQQDVEIGREVSRDAERQLPMLNDRRVDSYLNSLGQRLAAKAPGERYPYQFKAVNDASINAFALPGGFLYVNRGVIEAADNEAQLAGVMGHEIGHVALRHGTNQASKAYLYQVPLGVLGGVVGSNSIGAILAQIGAGFAVNSVLLKYSRDAERQADLIGTQILYDNGYDPRAMAQFFEKLQEGKGGRGPEWFSSHPNPENRIGNITKEIEKLGGHRSDYRNDSAEFREIQRYVQSLPAPARGLTQQRPQPGGQRPGQPSGHLQTFENNLLRFQYPDNWRVYQQGDAVTLAPDGGIVNDNRGRGLLAHGVIVSVSEPRRDRHSQVTLEAATDQLIDNLQESNPGMRIARDHGQTRVGGQPALSTQLTNDSPVGGAEVDWLVTVLRPEGLIYFVFVSPEQDFREFSRGFETILKTVRFR
jgi:Zn-dependent protease with chaperone function